MSGCRIGKVKMKSGGAELHIMEKKEPHYLAKTLISALNRLDEQSDCVGWFIVKKNGATAAGYAFEAGSSDAHLMGGVELLKLDIVRGEKI